MEGDADQLVARFLELLNVPEDQWFLLTEKRGVRAFQLANDELNPRPEFAILKGVGRVKASPLVVRDTLIDSEARKKWDLFYEDGQLLKWIVQDKEAIVHLQSKTYSYLVWPRDACLRVVQRELEPGVFLMVARSIENDELCPSQSSHVRGEVIISGFHVRPIDETQQEVEITYIFQANAQGWLPTALTDLVTQYQPLSIIGIRKLLTGSSAESSEES